MRGRLFNVCRTFANSPMITTKCFDDITMVRVLQNLCNKFLKLVFDHQKTSNLNNNAKFELLKINDILKVEVCSTFIYKALQRMVSPTCFGDIFIYNHERHNINLRNKNNLYVSIIKKTLSRQSLLYIGAET